MKNGNFSDYKIFTGNSNPAFAEEIAEIMGKPLGKATVTKFSDGEISVNLWETVRGSDCYIVQSTCDPVNDNLMELLIMIDAARRASAARITAVLPYFGYARQDRKTKAIKKHPRFVKSDSIVFARLSLSKPVCMETFDSMPQLGRFTIRDEGKTIAIGKVTKIINCGVCCIR